MATEETTTTEEAPKKAAPTSPMRQRAEKKTPKKTPKVSAADRAKAAASKKTRKPKKTPKGPSEKQQAAAAEKAAKLEAQKEALKGLTETAREVRARIEAARKNEKQALDKQVSAAVLLAGAKAKCKENGIKFPDWCNERLKTESFDFGYEQARKLASAGEAGGEEEVRLAIEDMRARNAASKRKQRAEASEGKAKIGHNSGNTTAPGSDGAKKTPKDKFTQAREAVNDLDDKAAAELARDLAAQFDERMIAEADYKKWLKLKDLNPLELLNYAFGLMSDEDKKKAVEQLADDLGATLEFPE